MTTIKYLFALFIMFITPIKGLIIIAGAFVLLDTVLGIYTNVKLKGWKSFKSSKFFNVAVKSFFYMGTILLAYLIDHYIIEGTIYDITNLCSKVVTMLWVIIEAKSIDENSVKLGNKPVLEIIRGIITKLKGFKKDFNEIN